MQFQLIQRKYTEGTLREAMFSRVIFTKLQSLVCKEITTVPIFFALLVDFILSNSWKNCPSALKLSSRNIIFINMGSCTTIYWKYSQHQQFKLCLLIYDNSFCCLKRTCKNYKIFRWFMSWNTTRIKNFIVYGITLKVFLVFIVIFINLSFFVFLQISQGLFKFFKILESFLVRNYCRKRCVGVRKLL